MILVWGKAKSHRAPDLGCRGLSHLRDLMFLQNTLHEMWCMSRLVVVRKLPVSCCPSCGLLNYLNSFHGGMFKLNGKFDADSLLHLLILNDGHSVYCPHWLVQWSCHRWHMHIPVHVPWLPGHTHAAQTVLATVTMTGPLPCRPGVCTHLHRVFHSREWEQGWEQRESWTQGPTSNPTFRYVHLQCF